MQRAIGPDVFCRGIDRLFLNHSDSRVGVGFVEEMLASLGQRVEEVGIGQAMCLFFDQKCDNVLDTYSAPDLIS